MASRQDGSKPAGSSMFGGDTRNKILVGLAVAVLSGMVGFYINRYLTKERLVIEHVDIFAERDRYLASAETWAQISRPPRLCDGTFFGTSLREVQTPFGTKSLELFKRWMENRAAHLRSAVQQINQLSIHLKTRPPSESATAHLSAAASIGVCYQLANDANVSNLLVNVEQTLESVNGLLNSLDSEIERVSAFNARRTGAIRFVVSIINYGDTDGLVRREAVMDAEGVKGSLPLILTSAPDKQQNIGSMFWAMADVDDLPTTSTTVPRRSAVQLHFVIDEGAASNDSLRDFKARVERNDPVSIDLQLIDFKDVRIPKVKVTLPVRD